MLRLLHKTGTRPPEVPFSCRRMAARHCWAGRWTLSTIQSWTQCLPFNIVRCPLTDAPKRWYKSSSWSSTATESLTIWGRCICTFVVSKCHTWVWRPATRLPDSDDGQLCQEDDQHVLDDDHVVADRADHDHICTVLWQRMVIAKGAYFSECLYQEVYLLILGRCLLFEHSLSFLYLPSCTYVSLKFSVVQSNWSSNVKYLWPGSSRGF